MLKSCVYCGMIHDKKYVCIQERVTNEQRAKQREKRDTEQVKIRNSNKWKIKTRYIKSRDKYMCQACLNGIGYLEGRRITTKNLQVHHIIPLKADRNEAFNNENLITLCEQCHELAEQGKIPRKKLVEIAQKAENIPPGI